MNITMSNIHTLNSAHTTMHWALAEFVENAIHEIKVIDEFFEEEGDAISFTDEHNAGEHQATLVDCVIEHIEAMRDLTKPMTNFRHIPARKKMMEALAEYPLIWGVYIREQRRTRPHAEHGCDNPWACESCQNKAQARHEEEEAFWSRLEVPCDPHGSAPCPICENKEV